MLFHADPTRIVDAVSGSRVSWGLRGIRRHAGPDATGDARQDGVTRDGVGR